MLTSLSEKTEVPEVKSFTQGHTAADGQDPDLNPAAKLQGDVLLTTELYSPPSYENILRDPCKDVCVIHGCSSAFSLQW